ncbi:hypothetical protein [Peribacillus huizhouensis]|uniref:DUF5673 domain-containing protein n=1 Tax=Peribacillus huizhouensis TaxID=1501239 RepID=A0ABR6CWD4_9BACI|nr:hypothetical protein [Peribacillus huizhouensis]MBA9029008.1 hypothetical protein [Peribacillus huizhouensis]
MKALKSILLGLFGIIAVLILFLAIVTFISFIQEKLFVPDNSLLWIFKSPASKFIFIYEFYLMFSLILLLNKDLRKWFSGFFKKHRRTVFPIFCIVNIILFYAIVTDVAVVTKNKIINHSFLVPQGKQYSFNNITNITTGIYGKKQFFGPTKGDFYYIIELKGNTKIDLGDNGVSPIIINEDDNDEADFRFILAKLDRQWVDMGVPKKSSMSNFKYTFASLDRTYSDKIRSILENNK